MTSWKQRMSKAMKSFRGTTTITTTTTTIPHHDPKTTKPNRVIRTDVSDDNFVDASSSPFQTTPKILPSNSNQSPPPSPAPTKPEPEPEPKLKLKPEPIDSWELIPPPTNDTTTPTNLDDPLQHQQEFPIKCPPGGQEVIILYTTSLGGIRKTFEECNRMRALLENLRVVFHERDVSMDKAFREELWAILDEKVAPPRLFIRGRYVGGADDVVALHEQGRLGPMLKPVPKRAAKAEACDMCGGVRFVVCGACDGSRKVFDAERNANVRCRICNENGLVPCPKCI